MRRTIIVVALLTLTALGLPLGAGSHATASSSTVVSGTITGWEESTNQFHFDDYLSVDTDLVGWWSQGGSDRAWMYGYTADTHVAYGPISTDTEICEIRDASTYAYEPWSEGLFYDPEHPTYNSRYVMFHNTTTGFYGAFRIDDIYDTEFIDLTWYAQTDGTADFGPCEPVNQPPVADANGPYTANEGDLVTFDGSGSTDPDGDPLAFTWTLVPANGAFDGTIGVTPTHVFGDNYGGTVTLTVEDDNGLSDTTDSTVTINNVAPDVGPITGLPTEPIATGATVDAQADFTDPGFDDTHEANWDWGDGITETGTIIGIGGSITTFGSHAYDEPGIYSIYLTVTDDDGGATVVASEYIVVYDPSAGFVTGGGWFDSPEGAMYPGALTSFDGSYYELVPVDPWMDWYAANSAANAMSYDKCEDAHLATITSAGEQAVLAGLMAGTTENAWIGGFQPETELDKNANWQWVTGEPFSFTNWDGGEPNDNPYGTFIPGSEQYLETYQVSGVWNDAPGYEPKAYYVVEYEDCDSGPTGKATFGFVSKYKKGAGVPTGNTEFRFNAGNLDFQSCSYDWWMVAG
ncbi:MAG: PKD domain-containing protein, partial [Actinomycetota bacterium]